MSQTEILKGMDKVMLPMIKTERDADADRAICGEKGATQTSVEQKQGKESLKRDMRIM